MSFYDSLGLKGAAIRVLNVQPGEWDEKLSCNLVVVDLDEDPQYEAISYVWGNPQASKRSVIQVNGMPMSITQSLYTALKRYRLAEQTRTMWADAICINQEDLQERSLQVLLMGRVYSQCTTCQIWLGL
ncbi:heterokaryon incompatibility protein-domain-containing protein, partial [Coniella lustricola]